MNDAGTAAKGAIVGPEMDEETVLRDVFPFSAIVGQEGLKRALLLSAINPSITGVLIRGPKGCGKTTAVRSLIEVLPDIEVVKGCRFSCDPKSPGKFCDECKDKFVKGNIVSELTEIF